MRRTRRGSGSIPLFGRTPQPTVSCSARIRGLRSRPFDGEGVATARRSLIENGRLTGWLLNSAAARQLGLATNGHATRGVGGAPGVGATNIHLTPGTQTPAQLIADISHGLYVTEMIGQGINPVTGDYSRGATGFIIRNGEVAEAVAEITAASAKLLAALEVRGAKA